MKQKDELIDALRERLSDLEAPVDPGLWAGIQARMAEAAVASGTDPVTELFRDGLKNAEAPVDPGVWSNISSQLGHPAAAGTMSVGAWVGGGIAAAVVVGGLWWGMSSNDAPAVVASKQQAVMEQVVEPVAAEQPGMTVPSAINTMEQQVQGPVSDSKLDKAEPSETPLVKAAPEQPFVAIEPGSHQETSVGNNQDAGKEELPPIPGPHFAKVQAIMAQEAAVVNSDPQPPVANNDQALSTFTAPTTDVEPEEEEGPLKTEEASLFIPNVFTPNNDGVNDRLEVSATGVSDIRVSIYSASSDRLMYRATDLTPWDGRDPSGVLCPEGYYFYAIEATGPDGKTITKGTVVRLNTH